MLRKPSKKFTQNAKDWILDQSAMAVLELDFKSNSPSFQSVHLWWLVRCDGTSVQRERENERIVIPYSTRWSAWLLIDISLTKFPYSRSQLSPRNSNCKQTLMFTFFSLETLQHFFSTIGSDKNVDSMSMSFYLPSSLHADNWSLEPRQWHTTMTTIRWHPIERRIKMFDRLHTYTSVYWCQDNKFSLHKS